MPRDSGTVYVDAGSAQLALAQCPGTLTQCLRTLEPPRISGWHPLRDFVRGSCQATGPGRGSRRFRQRPAASNSSSAILRRAVAVSGVTLTGAVPQPPAQLRQGARGRGQGFRGYCTADGGALRPEDVAADRSPLRQIHGRGQGGKPFAARSRGTAALLVRLAANLGRTAHPRRFCRKVDSPCGRGFSDAASPFAVAAQENELPRRRFTVPQDVSRLRQIFLGRGIVAASCGKRVLPCGTGNGNAATEK